MNIKCPNCNGEVEIWSDETQARCSNCKSIVTRNLGQSCLDWCKYAEKCVGKKVYKEYKRNKSKTKTYYKKKRPELK